MSHLSPEDQLAIGKLWEQYGLAMGKKDAAAAAALYASDGDMIGLDGTLASGPSAIEQYYRNELSGKYEKVSITEFEISPARGVTEDVALVNGRWLVHGLGSDPIRVNSTFIVRRERGEWRYVAARFMPAVHVKG